MLKNYHKRDKNKQYLDTNVGTIIKHLKTTLNSF